MWPLSARPVRAGMEEVKPARSRTWRVDRTCIGVWVERVLPLCCYHRAPTIYFDALPISQLAVTAEVRDTSVYWGVRAYPFYFARSFIVPIIVLVLVEQYVFPRIDWIHIPTLGPCDWPHPFNWLWSQLLTSPRSYWRLGSKVSNSLCDCDYVSLYSL